MYNSVGKLKNCPAVHSRQTKPFHSWTACCATQQSNICCPSQAQRPCETIEYQICCERILTCGAHTGRLGPATNREPQGASRAAIVDKARLTAIGAVVIVQGFLHWQQFRRCHTAAT